MNQNLYKQNFLLFSLLFFAIFFQNLFAQEQQYYKFSLEISTDNDALGVTKNYDRYYTYGAGLRLFFKSEKLLGLQNLFSNKTDYFFSAGFRTEGYAPTRLDYSSIDEDDLEFERPFAGLLFGTFDVTYLFKNSFFRSELYLGVLGPSAKSEEIQSWIHKNITDDELVDGWQYQMPDQLILNFNFSGAYDITPNAEWFDVFTKVDARIGNLYIDTTPTLGFRIGNFGPLNSSASFGNGINASSTIKEIYLQSSFSVNVVGYDATAQGKLFGEDYKYAVDDISNFYTSMSHGIFFTRNRFAFGYDNIFTFGKVNKKIKHAYARVSFKYRF